MHPSEILVRRLLTSIEARDYAAVVDCFTADARLWRSFDPIDAPGQTAQENAETLAWIAGFLISQTYEIRNFYPTSDGFILTLILTAQTTLREVYNVPLAMCAKVVDGRIAHIEEYFDAANMRPLNNAIRAAQRE